MATTYTEKTFQIFKFVMFCYNYDREVLHEGFRQAARAAKIKTEYYWDKFMAKVDNKTNPSKNIDSQFAIMEMITEIGSIEGRNAFIEHVMNNYKGV